MIHPSEVIVVACLPSYIRLNQKQPGKCDGQPENTDQRCQFALEQISQRGSEVVTDHVGASLRF